VPGATKVVQGAAPQLALEAMILEAGGYPTISADAKASALVYWKLSGGETPGEEENLGAAAKDGRLYADLARAGIVALAQRMLLPSLYGLHADGLLPEGLTLQNAYLQHSSGVGNVARQATIAEEALKVVHEQSVQLRENVAGVNLDEEASDLIRLQQAYQASARVMQTATTMFDTLLQIR
jgi:flagellar hook-associated protein FlgK